MPKLTTESKKVVASLAALGAICGVNGTARVVNDCLVVSAKHDAEIVESAGIIVPLSQLRASVCAFVDRGILARGRSLHFFSKKLRFSFCLAFKFPRGGFLCFMEIAD
jgi:hypothetical protein